MGPKKVFDVQFQQIYEQNKLLLPFLPHNDDFLRVMHNVFFLVRLCGIPAYGGKAALVWSMVLLLLLSVIEVLAIWKVIRALAGWAIESTGGRSIISRMSGSIFYGNALISLILSIKISYAWKDLSVSWTLAETSTGLYLPPIQGLKKKMLITIYFVGVCALLEHVLSMISATGFDIDWRDYMRLYILNSHGFILRSTDYSLWTAIPIFVISKFATIYWNFQDMIIILISYGLTSRYKRLNKHVEMKILSYENEKEFELSPEDSYENTQVWRRIREAYVRQSLLVRKLDGTLGGLILLSNLNNFYFICFQLFNGICTEKWTPLNKIYYIYSVAWLIFRAVNVAVAAADINLHSTKAILHLYRCPVRYFNIEIKRLIKQLSMELVALSGMGFYYINRRMLLEVAASILTYELVLLQYDI